MVNRDAAFSHHRFKIAVADWVSAVPAHRPEHDLTPEVTSLEVVHAPTPHPIQRREFTNPDELCNRASFEPWTVSVSQQSMQKVKDFPNPTGVHPVKIEI